MNPTIHTGPGFGLAGADLARAAEIAVREALGAREGERALIVTNPEPEVLAISQAVYDAFLAAGARPSLIVQPVKTMTDYAEEAVIEAFKSEPEIFVSLSAEKLGKDRAGLGKPYEHGGRHFDHIFHYYLRGRESLRAFWSPTISRAMFVKTLAIDYAELRERARRIKDILDEAEEVRVSNPQGTDLLVGLRGRAGKLDDGDFRRPGTGGNLPAGETFISPELGSAEGSLVFDGSIADTAGVILIREPIRTQVRGGFVGPLSGGPEAQALERALTEGAQRARELGASGKFSAEKAELYARNARNLGELGIGLNPRAEIVGNMLEDEKAFRTCHFALGSNYDEDAPAMIHLDGLVTRPTIVARLPGGREVPLERDGELLL